MNKKGCIDNAKNIEKDVDRREISFQIDDEDILFLFASEGEEAIVVRRDMTQSTGLKITKTTVKEIFESTKEIKKELKIHQSIVGKKEIFITARGFDVTSCITEELEDEKKSFNVQVVATKSKEVEASR